MIRTRGRLIEWFVGESYGFIQTDDYEGNVIAHIHAFPKGESQPKLNEILIFDLEKSEEGAQAHNIQYASYDRTVPIIKPAKVKQLESKKKYMGLVLMIIIAFLIMKYIPSNALITTKNQPASPMLPSAKV